MSTLTVSTDRLPVLSSALAHHVRGKAESGGWLPPDMGALTAELIADAQVALRRLEAQSGPASADDIVRWTCAVAPHLPGAPASSDDRRKAAAGFAMACADLPAFVWSRESVAAALRQFEWWPPPAKVRQLLLPFAAPIWPLMAGLRRVANSKPTEAPEPIERSEAAKVAVAELIAGFSSSRVADQPTPIKSRALSPEQLAAAYRHAARKGGQAASARRGSLAAASA